MNMSAVIDILEERAVAVANLVSDLREKVAQLETMLAALPAPGCTESAQPAPPSRDPALVMELERLRTERIVIRDTIRRLIEEIDRVAW